MIGQGQRVALQTCRRKPGALSRCHARQITLTATERRRLKQIAFSHSAPYQLVIRVPKVPG
jgi:hypothetical protein